MISLRGIVNGVAAVITAATCLLLSDALSEEPFGFGNPSEEKPLAVSSLLLGISCAKMRCLAVGERGHVLSWGSDGAIPQQLSSPSQSQLNAVSFLSAQGQVAYAVGEDGIVLKIEESRVVKVHSDLEQDSPLFTVHALSNQQMLVAGAYGYCIRGTEKSWETCQIDPDGRHVYKIIRLRDGGVLAVGEAGLIARSETAESEFLPIESPYQGTLFGALQILHQAKSVVVAFGLRGTVLFSEDDGNSFELIKVDSNQSLLSAVQVAQDSIVLVGLGGVLLEFSLVDKQVVRSHSFPGRPALTGVVLQQGKLILSSDTGLLEFDSWQW